MRILLFIFTGLVLGAQPLWAQKVTREGNRVIKTTPYADLWSNAEGIKLTAQIGHRVLGSVLESMHKNRIVPDSILSVEDLKKYQASQKDVDDLVDYLNQFVAQQRAKGGKLEKVDVLPDAIMFFGGQKVSVSVGKALGGSISLGLILMPVWEEVYDIQTNKLVSEGVSMRTSVVVWPAADAGFGLGGGIRSRIGMGFIWGNGSFLEPSQFWGAGPGVSWSPVTFGVGLNVKVGVLANWEMPGWIDFTYATAALEVGPTAELGTPRLNVSTVMSGPAVMGFFDQANKKAYSDVEKDMLKKMDEVIRTMAPKLPKRGKTNGGEVDTPVEEPQSLHVP